MIIMASLVAQLVKNPPAMQETQARFLGGKDPLEKGNGNPLQYSCLENPMDSVSPTIHDLKHFFKKLQVKTH